jgi:hypothetical protein
LKFTHIPPDFDLKKLKSKTTQEGRYYWDPKNPDVKWPSITTVLKEYNKGPIIAWRKRVGAKEANRISKAATSRGDSLHKMIERYLQNENPSTFKALPKHKSLFSQTRMQLDRHINNIVLQEQAVVSPTLKVAGKLDLIAEWDGVLSVIDFKGSNKRKREEWITNYYMQSSFYAFAYWEQTGILPKQIVVLITADDFTVIPYIVNSAKYIELLKKQIDIWYKRNRK